MIIGQQKCEANSETTAAAAAAAAEDAGAAAAAAAAAAIERGGSNRWLQFVRQLIGDFSLAASGGHQIPTLLLEARKP